MDPVARCMVDPSLERVVRGDMQFPLGVYPVEPIRAAQGYAVEFESSEVDADPIEGPDDLEQWPDRYVYDIVVSAPRLWHLTLRLIGMMPPRFYPILDYIGHDAFREIDPYIAYDLIPQDRYLDGVRRYRPFLLEDGMCGFGAMSEEPFMYFFVDEHKIITVRLEPSLKERFEKLLDAFGLRQIAEPAGADAAAHEHRSVLATPPEHPDMLSADEVVEWLRDEWRLTLNVDPEANVDDSGRELGYTPFRCIVRWLNGDTFAHGEAIVVASCLAEAEDLALDASAGLVEITPEMDEPPGVISADRMTAAQFAEALGRERPDEVEVEQAASVVRVRNLS